MFAYVTVKKNTYSDGNDTQCTKNEENSESIQSANTNGLLSYLFLGKFTNFIKIG